MAKNKKKKFAELDTFANAFQNFGNYKDPHLINNMKERVELKGKWNSDYFHNNNPLVLELACGKGEYTIHMALADPAYNYIGIDIKGNRIWRGAKTAIEKNIAHTAFVRTTINVLDSFFAPGEVAEIWITFPDPHLRKGKENKRLTSKFFLDIYKKVLKPDGIIHLKTDDDTLYQFTLDTIAENGCTLLHSGDDIYAAPLQHPFLEIKTFYEQMHLEGGKKIKYVAFMLG
ncbi:MAG: tRNA (guanosine(46)-N7)-methyltransferase TrmB [Chitinophagales bacterium]